MYSFLLSRYAWEQFAKNMGQWKALIHVQAIMPTAFKMSLLPFALDYNITIQSASQ